MRHQVLYRQAYVRPNIPSRPMIAVQPRIKIIQRAGMLESANQFATDMYLVSKSIIVFTMFYCSMNWWYYKRMREDIEKKNKK